MAGRIGVALLLGLALWNPTWHPTLLPMNAIIVLDESLSMGASPPDSALQVTATTLAGLPPGSRYSLIRFGADALLESADQPISELTGQLQHPRTGVLDTTGTNIEAALRLAGKQLASGTPELMMLITDGGETTGDATTLLTRFQALGLPIPYLLMDTANASGPDAAISALDAPSQAPFGSVVTLVVEVTSTRDGPAEIQVRKDSEPAVTVAVDLVRDQVSSVPVPIGFDSPGLQELEVVVSMPGDINAANDRRRAIVNVEGPGTVFYVTVKPGTAVADSLVAGGWDVHIIRPEYFPQALSRLPGAATVILDDVAIGDMPEPVWLALTESVRTQGTGLIVLGGQRSFGAGGYLDSTLETSLPVTSEAGAPISRAAVLFVVDKSGSMGRGPGDTTPFSFAKSAVLATTSLLGEHDQSGIIAFDIDPQTWLTLAERDDPVAAVMDAWKDNPSGGTRIAPALTLAAGQLKDARVDQRLLLLVTDGFATEDDYTDVLARIDEYEIDVIALAIGDEPGIEFLEALTSRNNGLLLRVSDVAMLPRLASESVGSRRLTYESSVTEPRQVNPLPFFADNDEAWPELNGYMVTKEGLNARVYLRSERGDPLLADHDFGLGRVVVLPGGLGTYAPDWPEWPAWAQFIGGLVEWSGNRFGDDRLFIRFTEEDGHPQLEIDALSINGDWETTDMATVSLSDPFGRVTVLNAQATVPGKYRVELPLRHTGHHRVSVQVGSISKRQDFFYETLAEMNSGSHADKIISGWLEKELVRPWSVGDAIPPSDRVTQRSTRAYFIIIAALLYLGVLLSKHAYYFHDIRNGWSRPKR